MSLGNKLAKRFDYTKQLQEKYDYLERQVQAQSRLQLNLQHQYDDLNKYARELEDLKAVANLEDLTTMAVAVIEYRRALSLLGAPDPVDAYRDVQTIFDKYNLNLPERPHDN